MTYSLENRNAIITGASRGLGLAIAKAYVRRVRVSCSAHVMLRPSSRHATNLGRADLRSATLPDAGLHGASRADPRERVAPDDGCEVDYGGT